LLAGGRRGSKIDISFHFTPSQWVSFFAVLPAESEMVSGEGNYQEIAAAIVTKASRGVLFTSTPAAKCPRMTIWLLNSEIKKITVQSGTKLEEARDANCFGWPNELVGLKW
jgi:hypothetical protein